MYRLEIPSLGISIHHWDICSAKSQCLGSDAICGFSQFVIIPITCRLKRHRPLGKNRRGSTSKLFAAYLQDLEDNVLDAIKHLGQSMDEVQCKLQNLLSLVLSSQARLQPSVALSALLGTQRAAGLRGDTISELSCSSLKVQLKRSLVHGDFFATRPLFEAVENGQLAVSSKKVLQLNDGIDLSSKIPFLEKYRSNRIFRFKISKTFYLFINNTLSGTAEDITKLSPTLFPINTTFTSTDFVAAASAIDYEPTEDRNLNALS